VTSENAKTQSWVMKAVWQRIPGRRARNSETAELRTCLNLLSGHMLTECTV